MVHASTMFMGVLALMAVMLLAGIFSCPKTVHQNPTVVEVVNPTGSLANLNSLLEIGKPLYLVKTIYGYNMAMDEQIPRESLLKEGSIGTHKDYFWICMDYIGKDQAVVDAGAHWGTYSLHAANAGHQVASYEPRPDNSRIVKASISLNGWDDKIKFFAAGVWHEDTTLYLKFASDKNDRNTFDSTVSTAGSTKEAGKTIVPMPVVTLDATVPKAWDVGFVKIDVQGADCNALEGAHDLIRRPGVKIVTIEFTPHNIRLRGGKEPIRILEMLDEAGYMIFEAERKRSVKSDEVGDPSDNLNRALKGDYSRQIHPADFESFVKEYDDESHKNLFESTPRIQFVFGELLALRRSHMRSN